LVAGHSIVIDYLINVGRPLIFTTALPSLLAMQVLHAVERLQSTGDELTMRLRERSCELRERLRTRLDRWSVPEGTTPIIPVIIGDDRAALQAAEQIAQAGFDVPAIRPPTVPAGTSRLRLNVSLSHSDAELREVVEAIVDAEHRVAA
jgi:7-keto-8-aminopelargonate synthetase-like enzyme